MDLEGTDGRERGQVIDSIYTRCFFISCFMHDYPIEFSIVKLILKDQSGS
jgi:hypothetical protein